MTRTDSSVSALSTSSSRDFSRLFTSMLRSAGVLAAGGVRKKNAATYEDSLSITARL
jgi:hypothetical protein